VNRKDLLESARPELEAFARRWAWRHGVEVEDAIQHLLMEAWRRTKHYRPEYGLTFRAYVLQHAKAELRRWLSEQSLIPVKRAGRRRADAADLYRACQVYRLELMKGK